MFGEDNLEGFEEAYQGCYESKEDFVEEQLENLGIISALEKMPSLTSTTMDYYINTAAIVTDLESSNYTFETVGSICYVFSV